MIKKIFKYPGIVFLSLVIASFPVMASSHIIFLQNQYSCTETLNAVRAKGEISYQKKLELKDDICDDLMRGDGLTHRLPIWIFWSATFTLIGITYKELQK